MKKLLLTVTFTAMAALVLDLLASEFNHPEISP
jgi:hypothetical protein